MHYQGGLKSDAEQLYRPVLEREDGVLIWEDRNGRFVAMHPDGRSISSQPSKEDAMYEADVQWDSQEPASHEPQRPDSSTSYKPIKKR